VLLPLHLTPLAVLWQVYCVDITGNVVVKAEKLEGLPVGEKVSICLPACLDLLQRVLCFT
jgi:hypothetical protein